jgi:monoamine oxidase
MRKPRVIIVGAGAAGLMAGRELARAGNEVIILEARNRLGGRIYPLDENDFGYPAQGGAEFVHGNAPVTHALAHEAGLTLAPREGEVWRLHDGTLSRGVGLVREMELVELKLKGLKQDITIAAFLDTYFSEQSHSALREAIKRMVEGYDAADPRLASAFALRDEWMADGFGQNMRIKEGYGALIAFLETDCMAHGVQIRRGAEVETIDVRHDQATVTCRNDGHSYEAESVLVTVPLPLLLPITFLPSQPRKIEAARNIGFGAVIKIILRFETRWWLNSRGVDLGNMFLLRSDEAVPVWWTQYPQTHPVLTGWVSGPKAANYINMSSDEILEVALTSLANSLDKSITKLKRELVTANIVNWAADRYARGAYTYATLATAAAKKELAKPVNGTVFFAGEALHAGTEMGTVEAALASGVVAAADVVAAQQRLG